MPRHPSKGTGHGGPAQGGGYGGPAKGAGNLARRHEKFTPETQPSSESKILGWDTKAGRDALALEMLGIQARVARRDLTDYNLSAVTIAAQKVKETVWGLAVAKVITASLDDVPDDQLDARIAELQGRLGNE